MGYILPLSLCIIGLALFLWARHNKRPSAGAVNGWKVNWSHGMPAAPTPQGAGWVIDVPPVASLHYVQNYKQTVREGQILTARVRVTGTFASLEGGAPSMSLILQRKGDRGEPGYRYFSFAAMPLTEGEHTLAVTVDSKNFGDVLENTGTLAAVLADLESVGVMFGSDDGRGHGVYTSHGGRIELLSLA